MAARKDTGESAAIHLSGFRSSSKDKDSTFSEDSVTPLERRLYFSTAHFHLRGGCPALAVEVLSKLPNKVFESTMTTEPASKKDDGTANTGVLHDDHGLDWKQPEPTKKKVEEEAKDDGGFDWGAPVSSNVGGGGGALELDWSQPVGGKDDDELKLEWSDDAEDSDEDEQEKKRKAAEKVKEEMEEEEEDKSKKSGVLDIMAQQLKFIACLKIMMEELSTLATGFEVDGGVLRYQLYIWLEREVEALKQLCNYGATDATLAPLLGEARGDPVTGDSSGGAGQEGHLQSTMRELFAAKGRKPTLHEVMIAEKADFQAKMTRANRRKQWLRANQTLLRTLLSYCGLHGSNGGGLASVRMELILLLQELQQERATHKQLQSPLPFPTTLPLLSACIAQQKTVVTDPIKHLQAAAHDMLNTLVGMRHPPLPSVADYSSIFLLRDLCVALSACIYQSLCDSDSINMKKLAARDGPASAILEALSRLSVVYQVLYFFI